MLREKCNFCHLQKCNFFCRFLSFFCHFVENLSFFCRFGASFSKLVEKDRFFFRKMTEKWQTKLKWQKNDKNMTKKMTDETEMTKKNDKKMTNKMTDKTEMTKKTIKKWQKNDRRNWNDKKNDKKMTNKMTNKTEMTKKTTKKWQKKWQTKLKWQKKWQKKRQKNDKINIWTISRVWLRVSSNLVPLVNIKIAGKWMFIPLKMVLIVIDPYPCKRLPEGNTTRCGVHQPFLDHFPVSPTGFSTSLGRNRCWLVNRTTTRWILWFMDVYGTYIELLII